MTKLLSTKPNLMSISKRSLVYGIGVNDADYMVNSYVEGKLIRCQIYRKWKAILERCYGKKIKEKRNSYFDCTMVAEWHSFLNFREWTLSKDWINCVIDKDVIVEGNKEYGPNTCAYIKHSTNGLLADNKKYRGNFLLGASRFRNGPKFKSQIKKAGKQVYLGLFETEIEAHNAWREAKAEQIMIAVGIEIDQRVKIALTNRAANLIAIK